MYEERTKESKLNNGLSKAYLFLNTLNDLYKHKGRRRRLVELLENKGIQNKQVLHALMQVPRHFFFPADFEDEAYEDKAFPIASGQTISQPYTVAFQSTLLEIKRGARVLDVGTGSGYQAAILYAMGCEVFTIERHELLYQKARNLFGQLNMDIHCFLGDGTLGLSEFAPYDGILVSAAAPDAPQALLQQLALNGRLVVPAGDLEVQQMCVYTRGVENKIRKSVHGHFKFVPLIGAQGWKEN